MKGTHRKTMWPSGLRRVTRNHFSSGGVGSNPAIVVFSQKESKHKGKKEKEGIGRREKEIREKVSIRGQEEKTEK